MNSLRTPLLVVLAVAGLVHLSFSQVGGNESVPPAASWGAPTSLPAPPPQSPQPAEAGCTAIVTFEPSARGAVRLTVRSRCSLGARMVVYAKREGAPARVLGVATPGPDERHAWHVSLTEVQARALATYEIGVAWADGSR